jgi:hypothetical protein
MIAPLDFSHRSNYSRQQNSKNHPCPTQIAAISHNNPKIHRESIISPCSPIITMGNREFSVFPVRSSPSKPEVNYTSGSLENWLETSPRKTE